MVVANTSAKLKEMRQEFLKVPYLCVGVLVAIEFLPKSPDAKTMRLLFTLAYFGALLTMLWYATKPREEYFKKLYEWKYQDSGPAIEQSWKLYLRSLSRVVRISSYLAMGLVGSIAFDVLDEWFSPIQALSMLYGPAYWLSLVGLFGFPIFFSSYFTEVFQRRNLLAEGVETTSFAVRKTAELEAAATRPDRPPVEVTESHEFIAGGMDWSWEDFYKNCIVFGQSGTGKTICVLNALLDGLLASTHDSELPAGGLILDPKGDFHSKIRLVCGKYGRERDLLVLDPLSPDESISWNPLDSEDDELELAARFAAVMESVGMKGGDSSFWVDSARKLTRHAIALIRLTNPDDEPPNFAQIGEIASNWDRLVERAEMLLKSSDHRALTCTDFFANEWAKLAIETSSSIQAQLTNMLDPFLMEPYRSFFSGRSTYRVKEMLQEGKILYVHMPIAEKEAMSRMVCTFVKLEYYREVLKQPGKKRSTFFLCDEFQAFFTTMPGKGDADFFERSRQSNHANLIATQNLPALLKQAPKEDPVMNLLGNCAVKLFLRNTDARTNQYASELFGKKLVIMGGASYGASQKRGVGLGSNQTASSQYDDDVRAEEFTRLLVPARRDQIDFCESIVHLASRSTVMKKKLQWKVHPLQG